MDHRSARSSLVAALAVALTLTLAPAARVRADDGLAPAAAEAEGAATAAPAPRTPAPSAPAGVADPALAAPVTSAPLAAEPAAGATPVRLAAAIPLPPPPPGTVARPLESASGAPLARAGSSARLRRLGLAVGADVPGGAAATLLYRPVKFLRLGGSLLYNTAGFGVGGEVTLAPYHWITPTLTLEGGHLFQADALSRISRYATVDPALRPWLSQFAYDYASAQVGFEVGAPNTFVFFLRAGLSRVWLHVHGSTAGQPSTSGAYVSSVAEPDSATLGLPSAKVGFAFYLY